ncbi:MAG: zinc-binding dehydrogenase [Marinilabiliaceae bacterium]|jgi:NADPH:quinone reductase-like Zn-dependent oxidoreductase|nr:zinc-binding dehydrogenase [Marinilabiliaceae bacterium]
MNLNKKGTMKAVTQEGPGGKLTVSDIDVPVPGKGEVLVKMKYAPINPSDISQVNGTFAPYPAYPFTPGIEGSGVVVETGKGIIASLRSGKSVACSSKFGKGGTWAEYMVTDATRCVPLPKRVPFNKASMFFVNPMTALSFIELAKKGRHSAIVNNAAASALGQMLQRLCTKNNITLINIVRKESQKALLEESGAEYILNSSEAGFKEELGNLTATLGAKLFFDAVGGEQSSLFAQISPPGSRIILYAMLSEQAFTLDSRTLLQYGKQIDGFSLPLYNNTKSTLALLRTTAKIKKLISDDLNSKIKAEYPLADIEKAISAYKAEMTGGKILLRF